jgi:hypothetical protein
MSLNQRYIEVNREERHFCALFAHALLSSGLARNSLSELVLSRSNIQLDPNNMEVYIEVAALRDYWKTLDDSKTYSANTHEKRRQFLNKIIENTPLHPNVIDKYQFFWTKGIDGKNTKLWNPGHWSEKAIKADMVSIIEQKKFLNIKWAFNAKPDMMIASSNQAILIEAKLESPESKYGQSDGDQEEIQKLVGYLLTKIVPAFREIQFHNMLLAKENPNPKKTKWPLSITWREVINIIGETDLDEFTKENFAQLRTRYYPK